MKNEFDSVNYYFARRLEQIMTEKGFCAQDFEDLDVCSKSSINDYLLRDKLPNLRTACRIAEFLDVSLDWLCGFDEEIPMSEALMLDRSPDTAPWL